MASNGYSNLKRDTSIKLFGKDIAVGNMSEAQRKAFQAEFNKVAKTGLDGPGYVDQLNEEIRTSPLPGTRPTDPASAARAGAIRQIGGAVGASVADNNRRMGAYEGAVTQANITDTNAIGSLTTAQERASGEYRDTAAKVRSTANDYNGLSAALFGGYAQGQGNLNAQDQAALGDYMGATAPLMTRQNARASDPADLQRQMGAYNMAMGQAGGSLDYSAAQYASNPGDVARQSQMYDQLYGVGQGSLDYNAAQWASDPADVQRQMQGYNDLRGIGQGSLDYQADNWQSNQADIDRQLQGWTDLRNAGQGSLDYHSQASDAFANPNDLKNQYRALSDIRDDLSTGSNEQRQVMEQYKSLSDPQVTAKERFLSELARREFESGDKSSRDAVSANLAARGMRSGGQQIAQQQAAHQQLSQDRLLKELGIQAQAVDRSMQALGGWGTAANSIRSGDQNSLNMQSGLTTAMRNASFDEEYKRGLGADAASANNQQIRFAGYQGEAQQSNQIRGMNDAVGTFNVGQNNVAKANNQGTRLAGYQGSAQQSNAIRNSNDAVGTFNVGQRNVASANNQATRLGGMNSAASQSNAIRSANDAVGTFNVGQTNIAQANNQQTRGQGIATSALQSNAIRSANDSQRQFEDTFTQGESERLGRQAAARAGEVRATTAQVGGRETDVFNGGQRAIDAAYPRAQEANRADWDATTMDLGMAGTYFGAVTGAADRRVGRASGVVNTGSNIQAQNTQDLAHALGLNVNQWAVADEDNVANSGW